jgi:uracil-DNA glycosylase family 4
MSEFQTALDLVQSTLRELREQGVDLRASADALARLASTPDLAKPSPAPAEPEAKTAPAVVAEHRTERPLSVTESEPPISKATSPRGEAPAPLPLESRVAPLEGSKAERLEAMRGPVLACTKCPHLVKSRTQVVFGVGSPEAELMFVGEAPGEDEDKQGEPFVGKAGQLLTKIIETMGYARGDVYIANVLKCRPDMPLGTSGNRKPKPAEMKTCLPYLREQIDIIRPRVIVALGATAMEGLTGATEPVVMGRVRGRWHDFHGTPFMATYHPAYLLRNQALSEKRKVWEDMLMVLQRLGKTITEKQQNYFLQK